MSAPRSLAPGQNRHRNMCSRLFTSSSPGARFLESRAAVASVAAILCPDALLPAIRCAMGSVQKWRSRLKSRVLFLPAASYIYLLTPSRSFRRQMLVVLNRNRVVSSVVATNRSTLLNRAFGTSFPVGGALGQGETTGEGHEKSRYVIHKMRKGENMWMCVTVCKYPRREFGQKRSREGARG